MVVAQVVERWLSARAGRVWIPEVPLVWILAFFVSDVVNKFSLGFGHFTNQLSRMNKRDFPLLCYFPSPTIFVNYKLWKTVPQKAKNDPQKRLGIGNGPYLKNASCYKWCESWPGSKNSHLWFTHLHCEVNKAPLVQTWFIYAFLRVQRLFSNFALKDNFLFDFSGLFLTLYSF